MNQSPLKLYDPRPPLVLFDGFLGGDRRRAKTNIREDLAALDWPKAVVPPGNRRRWYQECHCESRRRLNNRSPQWALPLPPLPDVE